MGVVVCRLWLMADCDKVLWQACFLNQKTHDSKKELCFLSQQDSWEEKQRPFGCLSSPPPLAKAWRRMRCEEPSDYPGRKTRSPLAGSLLVSLILQSGTKGGKAETLRLAPLSASLLVQSKAPVCASLFLSEGRQRALRFPCHLDI